MSVLAINAVVALPEPEFADVIDALERVGLPAADSLADYLRQCRRALA